MQIRQWAEVLHQRGLADWLLPFFDLIRAWGFVGGQLLWAMSPFIGGRTTASLAELLDRPEELALLQESLACLTPEEKRGSK